jgi:hypothetical protein
MESFTEVKYVLDTIWLLISGFQILFRKSIFNNDKVA